MPSILNMALLNPKVKIGDDEHEIDDMLKEIRTETKDGQAKKININSDEIEDKDTAI